MLTPSQYSLINGEAFDAVPACLFAAKANQHARILAHSDWLIRDKQSGRYVAAAKHDSVRFFQRTAFDAIRLQAVNELFSAGLHADQLRPISDVLTLLQTLGIDAEQYALSHQLDLAAEPYVLEYAGKDRYQRALWLERNTKAAWHRLQCAARKDALLMEAISGFRSHHYQMGIFLRKITRGLAVKDILNVNAAPGFSEHHSGRALDLSSFGEPAAEQSFENTPVFAWLLRFAGDFGFRLSYPRGNIHGISFEPWHWYHQGSG